MKQATRDKIDAASVQIVMDLESFQASYLGLKTHYWQGILTPSVASKEGTDKPIEIEKKPTDQQENWTGVLGSVTQPCAIEVHTHDGPDGKGYTVYLHGLAEDDTKWIKAIGVGKYSSNFAWREIKSGINR